MSDSLPPAGGDPISGVSSGWLWPPRCFALICILIAVVGVLHEHTRLGRAFQLTEGWLYFASLIPYLAVLCFLFHRGKNPFAFALGIAIATGLLGGDLSMSVFAAPLPIAVALCFLFRRGKNPTAFALGMATATGFLGGQVALGRAAWTFLATMWIWALLSDFSAWLLWAFFISSMMLGLSAYWAFDKVRSEAKRTRWIAFGAGIFAAVLVLILSSVVALFLSFAAMHI